MSKSPLPAAGEAMPAADAIDRRTLVGRMAALSAVAASGVALAASRAHALEMPEAASTGQSGLIPLFQAHREAWATIERLTTEIWDAQARWPHRKDEFMVKAHKGLFLTVYVDVREPSATAIYSHNVGRFNEVFDRLAGKLPSTIAPSTREAALADIRRERRAALKRLRAECRRIEATLAAAGVIDADKAWHDADKAEVEAADAILAYRCRSMEECRLRAEYILSDPASAGREWGTEAFDKLLASFTTQEGQV